MKDLKKLSLKTIFFLMSAFVIFSMLTTISFFIIARPNEDFLTFAIDHLKYTFEFIGITLIMSVVVFTSLFILSKIYDKIFKNQN